MKSLHSAQQNKLRLECVSIPVLPMQDFKMHFTSNHLTSTNQEIMANHFYFQLKKCWSGKLTHLSRCWGPAQLVAVIIVLRRPGLMGVATNSSLIASTKLITGQQWSKNQRKYRRKAPMLSSEIHISFVMFHRLWNLVAVSHDIVMS